VKQLREQCFEVAECRTIGHRWTFLKYYDKDDYEFMSEHPDKKKLFKPKFKHSFIQNNEIRNLYDTDRKAEKLKNTKFLDRDKRVVNMM
jgi:ATP-dependent Clp protease ATP-binding subunit ClpX